MVTRPGADSVNNVLGPQHPGQPPLSTSLEADSIVSDSTCSVNSTGRDNPHHQCRLKQTPSSAIQCAQSTAPLRTAPIINVAWSGLYRQRLNMLSQQHRSGQHSSTTSLGADSIVNVLSQQHRPGQPPSSTSLRAAPIINVLGQ